MSALKPCRDQTEVDPGHPQDGAAESRGRAMSKEMGAEATPSHLLALPIGCEAWLGPEHEMLAPFIRS